MLKAFGRLSGVLTIAILIGLLSRKLILFIGLFILIFKALILIAFLAVLCLIAYAIFRDHFKQHKKSDIT